MSDDTQEKEQPQIDAYDVLRQCCVAMQYSASALLAALELCQQEGDSTVQIRGDEDVEKALDRLKNLGRRNRSVFMRERPAGVTQTERGSDGTK